jgi:thiol:disulfide interchange protein
MKHSLVAASLLLVVGTLLGCEVGIEHPPDAASAPARSPNRGAASARLERGQLQFVEGFARGRELAVGQSKPMLVFFTAHWCTYCRQMAAEAFTNPQVINLSSQFVCVLVDADAEPEVCRQLQVSGYPTILFLSPRGVPLNRVVGKQPGHQLMMAMQAALQHMARRVDADEVLVR